ncbi:acyl-CoA dehydrogenase family protein, partial [Caballeronia terrestris]|uniref:acyl-CoA dehydrogenase family protein n=1 Tax=Caballeronia terrestris TaxID=1226301 RepID=UPI000AF623D6
MNFQHTEDRRMLADTLNRFITEQYGFAKRDAFARSETGFSRELWSRFAELGTVGALIKEADERHRRDDARVAARQHLAHH